MKRRALMLILLPLPLPLAAAPPAVQLIVEFRWVDSLLPPAAQAAVRDAATVVGTAGSVGLRGPGVATSTVPAAPPPLRRLQVLNGQRASLQLSTHAPLHWVDAAVELDPSAGPANAARHVHAVPRQGERRTTETLTVTPNWPGGRAPVRVAFGVDTEDMALQSTLDLPLARWQTVARTGTAMPPAPRGTLSSNDAPGQPERELQLRVSLQPPPSFTIGSSPSRSTADR